MESRPIPGWHRIGQQAVGGNVPCQQSPRAEFLRGHLPKELVGGSCAVVGSSDLLRLSPRGQEIDSHKLVWRMNNAPTAGWEFAVGRRTSLRVVNHVPIEKWVLLATNRSALRKSKDGDEYDALLCAPSQVEHGCIVSTQGAGRVFASKAFASKLDKYQQQYPSHRLFPLSDALLRYGARCNSELRGSAPSGGLLTVLLALAVCDSVRLYGFWPFCCRAHRGWPSMNYKYSQGNRTRWVCCSRDREKMELEFVFYEALARRGRLSLVVGQPPGVNASPEPVTGAERVASRLQTQMRFGNRVAVESEKRM